MSAEVTTKRRFSESNEGGDVIIKKQKTEATIDSNVSIIDETTGLSKCFHRIRAKMYLSLAPCHLEHPIEGLRQQHLDPLIMTFNRKVDGIIISYDNIKLSKEQIKKNDEDDDSVEFNYVAKVSDENPFSFLWAYVDFVVWKPRIGDLLEGYSIMQSQSHIGLLIHDVFNASIKKFYIPEDWYFVPNQADEESNENEDSGNNESSKNKFKKLGYWCDENGVAIGGKIKFTVRAIHVNGKGLAVEGTLLTPGMERDSKPVVMAEQIKENIKNHVKFDSDDVSDSKSNNEEPIDVVVDDETAEQEMKDSIPVIEPIHEEAPAYKDDSSDSDSDSNADSDSDSDNEKAKSADDSGDSINDNNSSSDDAESSA